MKQLLKHFCWDYTLRFLKIAMGTLSCNLGLRVVMDVPLQAEAATFAIYLLFSCSLLAAHSLPSQNVAWMMLSPLGKKGVLQLNFLIRLYMLVLWALGLAVCLSALWHHELTRYLSQGSWADSLTLDYASFSSYQLFFLVFLAVIMPTYYFLWMRLPGLERGRKVKVGPFFIPFSYVVSAYCFLLSLFYFDFFSFKTPLFLKVSLALFSFGIIIAHNFKRIRLIYGSILPYDLGILAFYAILTLGLKAYSDHRLVDARLAPVERMREYNFQSGLRPLDPGTAIELLVGVKDWGVKSEFIQEFFTSKTKERRHLPVSAFKRVITSETERGDDVVTLFRLFDGKQLGPSHLHALFQHLDHLAEKSARPLSESDLRCLAGRLDLTQVQDLPYDSSKRLVAFWQKAPKARSVASP